tara:strand:- start:8444 stop:8893 length:450 start_codon:yes stop_codon:yes gene_type:complete
MRNKVTRKTKEAAELADTHHRDGVTARIDQLRYGAASHDSLGTTAVATSPVQVYDPHDPYVEDLFGRYKPPLVGGGGVRGGRSTEGEGRSEGRRSGEEMVHPAQRSPIYEHYATRGKDVDGDGDDDEEIRPVQRSPVYDEHGIKVGYQR